MTQINRLYDTRYFWEIYTTQDPDRITRLRSLLVERRHRFVSSITLYELYKLSVANEGKDVAELRCLLAKKDMQMVSVDSGIAEEAARISYQSRIPMADALIIATAKISGAECITDDPHFTSVKTRWI
ncbi:MAG TPA: PIN domain-containing protein [Nitrososphaerales archaeon]|nr:PIN domain-containing protein [Nitrososphaerales archaeon]